jgi:hypothetical protein
LQEFGLFSLLSLLVSGLSLLSQNDVAIFGQVLLVLVVVLQEVLGESLELGSVFLTDVGDGDAGGRLLVDQLAESGLALDEAVGDVLVAAEVGEPDNQFDGVDVVGDDDELGLALLDESGHVVETALDVSGLGGVGLLFVLGLGGLQKTGLLLGSGLGFVLGEQLEERLGLVGSQSVGELVDDGRDLQTLEEDSLLALEENVSRPFHESGHIALRLNVSADLEDTLGALEEVAELLVLLDSLGADLLLSLTFCHLGIYKIRSWLRTLFFIRRL